MNRKLKFAVCLIGIFLSLLTGCNQKKYSQSDSEGSDANAKFEVRIPEGSGSEFTPQTIQTIKDVLTKESLPVVSGKDKDELNEIIKYLDDIQDKVPDHFEDDNNTIEFYQMMMSIHLLAARLNPDDFDLNLNVATNYLKFSESAKYHLASESSEHFGNDYKSKAIQSAKDLIKNFPENPLSYGQMAHTLHITGGNEKEVIGLLEQCLEVGKETEYCRGFLEKLTN